jgi:chemotaxis protein methyltransferase CheR
MVLSEFYQRMGGEDFSILATDISSKVLSIGRRGIYPENLVEPIPFQLKRKYLLRGKGSQAGFCRIVPELRRCLRFQRLNLIEPGHFGLGTRMHIIFCRNVVIYFDRKTQMRLFEKFYERLEPGGYLFIGHSESLNGVSDQFVPIGSAVYRKG